jgi:hypothetical protein
MQIKQFIVVSAGLVFGAALAACSGGGQHPGSGSPGSGQGASPDPGIAAIVACYRAHGDPSFPDPVYDASEGSWHFGISPGTAPLHTQQACQHLFPSVNPSPPVPQSQFRALVRLAQCIRQHGVPNWPDPNPDGAFPLPPALLQKTPASVQATTACRRYNPSGRINVFAAP